MVNKELELGWRIFVDNVLRAGRPAPEEPELDDLEEDEDAEQDS